ncbi:hypothetical protein CB1_001320011 [Camelus ferus]|nr:hypothetical protein CB1_001320011 [Camelus ferus]
MRTAHGAHSVPRAPRGRAHSANTCVSRQLQRWLRQVPAAGLCSGDPGDDAHIRLAYTRRRRYPEVPGPPQPPHCGTSSHCEDGCRNLGLPVRPAQSASERPESACGQPGGAAVPPRSRIHLDLAYLPSPSSAALVEQELFCGGTRAAQSSPAEWSARKRACAAVLTLRQVRASAAGL